MKARRIFRLLKEGKITIMDDIIQDRVSRGLCPICGGDYGIEYKIVDLRVTDSTIQKIRVCKKHTTPELVPAGV